MRASNKEIRYEAREALSGNWFKSAGLLIILTVIGGIFSYVSGVVEDNILLSILVTLVSIFVSVCTTGTTVKYFLNLADHIKIGYSASMEYGIKNAWPFFKLSLAIGLKVLAWSLLLVIPGIIASIRYSQAMFIKIENPEVRTFDAIKLSSNMMAGHKWRYFCLFLSFIGWSLLALLTLGIGLFWVSAYYTTARARFYRNLREGQTPVSVA